MREMRVKRKDLLLYAVTEQSRPCGVLLRDQVEKALRGGVTLVQLREKNLPEADLLAEAVQIRDLCRSYRIPFIINDNVDLALRVCADGVHVGQDDMRADLVRKRLGQNGILGVSAHNVAEALRAQECGADYLGAGAVFSTGSKANVTHMSYETLRAICDAVQIPVIAIGGIDADNIMQLAGSGICGVAVIRAIFAQKDVCGAAKQMKALAQKMVGR